MQVPAPTPDSAHPCVARPYAGWVHPDGPCRCFVGGPAPEREPEQALGVAS